MKRLLLFAICYLPIAVFAQTSQTGSDYVAKRIQLLLLNAPQPVTNASVSVSGNPGPATYYYWIVTQTSVGASSPAGPFQVINAPNTLSVSNFNQISWATAPGGATYDVLRTSTPGPPFGACNCAVATALIGNVVSDQSNSLNAYTVNTLDPATQTVTLSNQGGAFTTSSDPSIDVRAFGAKCDWNGTTGTDDSTALQNAINSAIAAGERLVIGKGLKCSHSATLNMTNSGATSVKLQGTGYSTAFVYTGTGTGWLWKDGAGNISISGFVVEDMGFLCSNALGCAKGIEAWDLQNGMIFNSTINADGIHFATVNFFCNGCAIVDIDKLVMEGQASGNPSTIGIDCVNCGALWIHNGNYFYFTTATMRFSGTATSHINIYSNWFESQDVGILLDDTTNVTTARAFYIHHNRFLHNGAGGVAPTGGTFANQVALKVNNTGTNNISIFGMEFTENSYFCATAGGLCSAAYPIVLSYSATTGASSQIGLDLTQNDTSGQATGLVNVLNGPSAAKTILRFKDNTEEGTSVLASGTQTSITPLSFNSASATQVNIQTLADTAMHIQISGGLTANQDACYDFGDKVAALKGEMCWTAASSRTNFFNNGVLGLQILTDGSVSIPVSATTPLYKTATNCSSSGGTCSAAPAGSVSIAAAATTVTVATTAVTANSQILVTEDSSLGTKLSVTCNTTTGRTYTVTTRTAGTSFVITASAAPVTNPACLSYSIVN
jgi:hypothetical protein